MSLKRKREDGPPGIRRRAPPGVKKIASVVRRRRQNKMRALLSKPQLKYRTTEVTSTEVNYDSIHSQCLNLIPVGDSDITRDGQTIVMNSLQIKGLCRNAATTEAGAFVRYLVVLDKMPNEVAASLSSLLDLNSNATDVYMLRSRGQSAQNRFKVLLDEVVSLGGATSSATHEPLKRSFKHFFKMAEICQFNDDGTANTDDFQKGQLWLYAISDIANASTGPTIEYSARVTFFDK